MVVMLCMTSGAVHGKVQMNYDIRKTYLQWGSTMYKRGILVGNLPNGEGGGGSE